MSTTDLPIIDGQRARAYRIADRLLDDYGELRHDDDAMRSLLAAAWLEGAQAGSSETVSFLYRELRAAL